MQTYNSFRWLSILVLVGLVVSLAAPGVAVQAAVQPAAATVASEASAADSFECSTVTEVPQAECQALTSLYAVTNGAGWTNHTGWLATTTPCSWFGVTCTSGHVTTLNLYANLLSGSIPPEIGNLAALTSLILPNNKLSGSIPPQIGQMAQLSVIYIANNQLSGPIPAEMGNLANLKSLVIWGNQLSGSIPTELGHLTQLTTLSLRSNQFSGTIPVEIGSMPALKAADFSTNQLCGSIPSSLGSSTSLTDLHLSTNHFYIPAEPLLSQLNAKTPNDKSWTANQTAGDCSGGKTLLALYVLAFDNGAQSTANLTGYFSATMQSIASATTGRTGVRAVVLSDLTGPDNVAVYAVDNGVVTQVTADLPTLSESTVVNGTELGGFFQWARATYPADQVSLYYVGHNKPLPQEGLNTSAPAGLSSQAAQTLLFPLPIHDGAHPDYTDATPTPEVLSVYDLAEALRLASANGAQPLDVLDISSCFSLSFEETYPLRNSTSTIVGSANYAFFEPALAGAFLAAQHAGMAPRDMAAAVMNAEDAALPATGHPRILTAIDTSKMDALKDAWDALSYKLWLGLNDATQRQSFKYNIVKAYQASNKFDCTFCQPQDWALETPDALVDLHSFAVKLRDQFGSTTEVGAAANNAFLVLYQLLIARTAHNGTPWFGNPAKTWNFDSSLGLSLYADFVGKDDGQGHILLSDIAPWYTREVSAFNPHPYEFVQGSAYGKDIQPSGINWADVFVLFWRDNTNLLTQLCLPAFPPVAEQGDLIAGRVISPTPGSVTLGVPVTLSATVKSVNDAHNVQVNFYVVQSGITILTATATVPFIAAGTETTATAEGTWTPDKVGAFTIYEVVDPELHFQETTRSNNYAYLNDTVKGTANTPRPEINLMLSDAQQWWPTSPLRLAVIQKAATITDDASLVNKLVFEYYQYTPGTNPNTQVPFKVATQTLSPVTLPQSDLEVSLPASLRPGIVVLHVWPYSDGGGMGGGKVVTFNYTPAGTAIANQQAQYFSFEAEGGEAIAINLSVAQGSTRMYVWMPGNSWSAQAISDGGTITINPALAGTYLVCVLGKVDGTQYTLSAVLNGVSPLSLAPAASGSSPVTTEIRQRPEFGQPPLASPLLFNVFVPRVMH